MTIWVNVDVGTVRLYGEVGVRVGMLVGRYLDDPGLVRIVAEDVIASWLARRRPPADASISTVEQWWNAYVELVEATAGGVDCATEDDLRRAWAEHARRLLRLRLADPRAAAGCLIEPARAGGGR
jgi:hypothetical protein